MIEIPCTLRCDQCGETKAIHAKTTCGFVPGLVGYLIFVVNDRALPGDWKVNQEKLLCPRCIEVK